ncbi:MAG: hypothetical protein KAK01_08150 [Candidatus Marinimicrobia bacterium]|nr:hypothetical protein [Candidatus Neomarinimicrobiota bacterium]
MKQFLKTIMILLLGLGLLGIFACADDDDDDMTVAETIVGVWLANATTGDLGNATASSGSLAGAGWTSYQLTLNANNTFSATGGSGYDFAPYGDGDGIINYSGTYTLDDSQDPMWLDLTCTTSDNVFFTTVDSLQPCQPGSFTLNADETEMTIQYGSGQYGIARPDPITVPSVLVKQ